ncbi:hypothetical protein SAMN06265365_12341 [Tistlia consotensis]|uniref:DUF3108 domain-containing protein n=1 Tax=Tistlia consotensis USBA 355 TaxID=560819 RepID=A0A1Y6CIF5_9PROT|nr:hypothetical protein [Tistlia consotensis]SMF64599.1 hypothetical protein SAMN05428998_12568 [Tistlia consotensis USBA 355]SNR97206.1 hypothetical protein SAMN06265365_12341 [Tistlia consotensis]
MLRHSLTGAALVAGLALAAPSVVPAAAAAGPTYAPPGTTMTWIATTNGTTRTVKTEVLAPKGSEARFRRGTDGPARGWYPSCWSCVGQDFDHAKYGALWPLEAGKSVDFLQRAGKDGPVWRHHLEVTGKRGVTTPAGRFETYVIRQSVTSDKGGWKGRSTTWWAPSLGWAVKYRSSDNEGHHWSEQLAAVQRP